MVVKGTYTQRSKQIYEFNNFIVKESKGALMRRCGFYFNLICTISSCYKWQHSFISFGTTCISSHQQINISNCWMEHCKGLGRLKATKLILGLEGLEICKLKNFIKSGCKKELKAKQNRENLSCM